MAVVHALPDGAPGIEVELEEVEVALLQSLAVQLIEFVTPADEPDADPLVALVGIDPDAATPEDPALRRLLPDAFREDPSAASEFRRYTERDLRARKAGHARDVLDALTALTALDALDALAAGPSRVRIEGDRVASWLGFLNDTRLTLGTRLDLTEDNHDELASLPEDDPRATWFQVYDWLTFLEESLVQSLLGR